MKFRNYAIGALCVLFGVFAHPVARAQGGSSDFPIVTVTNLTTTPTITRTFHTDGSLEWSITVSFSGATLGNPVIRIARR